MIGVRRRGGNRRANQKGAVTNREELWEICGGGRRERIDRNGEGLAVLPVDFDAVLVPGLHEKQFSRWG